MTYPSPVPEPFLRQVANAYLDNEPDSLIDYCFVTPGKRAGIFLSKYFSDCMAERNISGLLPAVTTISDFLSEFSPLAEAPRIRLLLVLYNVYTKVLTANMTAKELEEGKNLVDFNRFQYWGDVLLNDFNDVDRDMVDAAQLFKNVERLKEISANYLTPEQIEVIKQYWNLEGSGMPDVQRFWNHIVYQSDNMDAEHSDKRHVAGFIKIWQVMNEIYRKFREELAAEGLSYAGKLSRDAAEVIGGMDDADFRYKRYIFVGFNVLSTSEKRIFTQLQLKGMADFYWDYASPQFRVERNRASRFLRGNVADYPSKYEGAGTDKLDYYPEVTIMPLPSSTGQAKVIPGILRELHPDIFDDKRPDHMSVEELSGREKEVSEELAKTAVILPDEGLAQPVISALPREVSSLNVSIGFSLRHTQVAGLLKNIISMQLRAREVKTKNTFFYEDVVAVLSNPLIRYAYADVCNSLIAEVNRDRLFNVPVELLREERYAALNPIFEVVSNTMDAEAVLDYYMRLLKWLKWLLEDNGIKRLEAEAEEENEAERRAKALGPLNLDVQFISGYLDAVEQLRSLRRRYLRDIYLEDKTVFHLVERIVGNQTVNYEGLPLEGLQVMGVLESRCLDFENIVLCSMNERVFPRKHYAKSFIPNALRAGYHLSTTEHQECIYAYYFYRLISRARKVYLLYDARKTGVHSGGASRYLRQIHYQFPAGKVRMAGRNYPLKKIDVPAVSVIKSERVMRQLERFRNPGEGKRNLSASSLNAYLTCPLSFYIANVERYYPENDFVDYMDDSMYGTVVHDAAAEMYTDERGESREEFEITPAVVDKFCSPGFIERYVERSIKKNYLKVEPDSNVELIGDTVVYRNVMSRTIRKMVKREAEMNQRIFFVCAEKKIEISLKVSERNTINLSYTIDRVDRVENPDGTSFYRLVDYKTGADNPKASDIKQIFDPNQQSRPKAILQLLLYSLAYAAHEKYDGPIQPMVYQLRKIMVDDLRPIKIDGQYLLDYHDVKDEYTEGLDNLLSEIFDPKVPFVATPGEYNHNCKYCKFKEICGVPDNSLI